MVWPSRRSSGVMPPSTDKRSTCASGSSKEIVPIISFMATRGLAVAGPESSGGGAAFVGSSLGLGAGAVFVGLSLGAGTGGAGGDGSGSEDGGGLGKGFGIQVLIVRAGWVEVSTSGGGNGGGSAAQRETWAINRISHRPDRLVPLMELDALVTTGNRERLY